MNKRPVFIEPTIEMLKEKRNYHVTQREFHDAEITFYESELRKRRQQEEEAVISEIKFLEAPGKKSK